MKAGFRQNFFARFTPVNIGRDEKNELFSAVALLGVTHRVCKPLQTRCARAQRVSGWPFDLVLSGRADDFVCEVEKPVEAEPLTVPDPDAAVPEGIAEVLEDVVRRLARLAPRARVRARSNEGLLEYLYSRLRLNRA